MKISLVSQPQPSREAAEQWKTKYEGAYSPLAYGTRLEIRQNDDDTWTVHGSRFDSAD